MSPRANASSRRKIQRTRGFGERGLRAKVVGVVSPGDPIQKRLRVNGIELASFEWGAAVAGREPTILFVHATGFHGRCYQTVADALREHFHVWAPDLRGHGRGVRSPARFRFEDCADDVAAIAAELGVSSAIVAGS